MSMRSLRPLVAGLVLSAAAAGPALAQQQTWHACYVPGVGALYLIGLEGLPAACLAGTHVEISWTEGGAAITDHGQLTGLGDDDHPEYVREGEAATGDLGGTYPSPSVTALRGLALATTQPTAGQVLTWNATTSQWEAQTAASGVTDHGALTGLGDDDHPEYVREGEAAAGDLAGTYPAPSVTALQGRAVSSGAPTDGQVMSWNAGTSQWEARTTASGVTDHGALTGLEDDDHPQYLLADGVRTTVDGFAVAGQYGSGAIPEEGAGTRLMWYPGSAALRAGTVDGTQWDDAAVGLISVALGRNTTASGYLATALGASTRAEGTGATAMGNLAVATGNTATAMGLNTLAEGDYSTALGSSSSATGPVATAMGFGTQASGSSATAMGYQTVASGNDATAAGRQSVADGNAATALGYSTQASGDQAVSLGLATLASGYVSLAAGSGTEANGTFTTALGYGTVAQPYGSLVIGRFNTITGNPLSWVDTDPLFVAGNGFSVRSNALTLFKNGNLTIAGTLTESSDARLKTGVEALEPTLDRLRAITPVRFRFRDGTGHPTDPQIGLLAQEVAEAFPELVTTDSQGYLSLAYPKLTAVLLRAIQEQQDRIDSLEAQNRSLARQVDALERLVRSSLVQGPDRSP